MWISGDNITSYLVKVKPDYKVDCRLALDWVQSSSGNYSAVDRTSVSDIYETTIVIAGKQDVVEQFINEVEDNRLYDTYYFTLSGFEATEHIFGEELVYTSPLTVTVLNIGDIKQKSWKVYEVEVKMRLLSPITFSASPRFPSLLNISTNIVKKIDSTINKYDSYNGTFSYLDHSSDSGILGIDFILPVSEVKELKKYYQVNRGSTIVLTSTELPGISYPFGTTRSNFPISVKILELTDDGWFGLTHRKMSMKIAEVC